MKYRPLSIGLREGSLLGCKNNSSAFVPLNLLARKITRYNFRIVGWKSQIFRPGKEKYTDNEFYSTKH